MSEFSTLADFGEGMQDVSDTAFGAFAFHSLPALEAEFGRDSEEYKTAVLALKAALATVRFSFCGFAPILGLTLVPWLIAPCPVRKPGSHLPRFQRTFSPS